MHFIDFVQPTGIDAYFNTFRLGLFYSKCLKPGETVAIVDNKSKAVVGYASVEQVFTGHLEEMLKSHAPANHAVISFDQGHHQRLAEILTKFYGPHIATPTRKTTVVYLRRIKWEPLPSSA